MLDVTPEITKKDWLYEIALAAAILLLLGLLGYSIYLSGVHAGKLEGAQVQAKLDLKAAEQLAIYNAGVLQQERDLRSTDRESFNKYKEGAESGKAKYEHTIAGLRADVMRLRVPIRPAGGNAQPDAGGPAGAGAGAEGYAELSGDASEFVVQLLNRGDIAIRKHAEVVDRYERLRLACTRKPQPTDSTPQ